MKVLLENYTISEIVIFVVLFVIALKEAITIIDWFKDKIRKVYDQNYHAKEEQEKLESEIEDLNKFYSEKKKVDDTFDKINRTFDSINARIEMLIDSDRESIKAYITEKHHFFVYDQEWIDDYSMECLEKRFAVYEKEHGNSFVLGLMNELRELPRRPPQEVEHKYVGTAEHIRNAKG